MLFRSVLAGKARALLKGRYHVSTEDIRQVALPVLRHRIVTNYSAEAEGYTTDRLIEQLLEATSPRESALAEDGRISKVLAG